MKTGAFALVVCVFATSALAGTLEIADFEKGKDDWGFTTGTEFPGAKGSFEVERGGKTGQFAARLDGDFTGGGVYVGISHKLSTDKDFAEVRFWIKSADASGITFRLTDATGQVHQQRPAFEPNGEWQLVTVKTFDRGPGYQTWGGAKDKRWHPPATGIAFSLEKGALKGAKGSVWIDGIEATLDPRRLIADFAIRPARLGNVFLTTEEPRIPIETQGDAISWRITDFWGGLVAEGKEAVADGSATIRPPDKRRGYFLVTIVAEKGGKPFAERETTFAVIAPVDLKSMPDNPFGVMTHFAQGWDTDILPLIARAGVGSIRDEHYWAQVEKEKGKFEFPERSDAYMAAAAKLGIDLLVVMSFENPLYDGGLTPYTPSGCDAYGRYGQAILQHYGKQVKWLEVWNEYNGSWCKGPAAKDRPRFYAQMLEHAWRLIKEARPDAQVIGCATVLVPIPYLRGIFEHGGLKHMDAVVIHPYRDQPEGVEDEVAELQDLIRKFNDGKDKPIWVTETGRWDKTEFDWERGKDTFELGRRNIARYLVRQYTLLLSRGVEKVYWYLARDYNEFRTMGLLHDADWAGGRYAAAPAYVAYATLIRQLYGGRPVRRERSPDEARVYLFRRGDEEIRVCWATEPTHIALKAGSPLVVVDMMDVEETLQPVHGEVYLTLTDSPVYLVGKAEGVGVGGRFTIAAEQSVDILEDVAFGYALAEGLAGHLEIGGKQHPVAGRGRVVIPGQDTSRPRSQIYWYRLVLDGKLAGKGGLVANVVDTVSFPEGLGLAGGDTLLVRLANASRSRDYTLASLRWKVGGLSGSYGFGAALPASKALTLAIPVGALPLYRPVAAEVTGELTGRSPVAASGEVSNNPCPRRTIKPDGDLADWAGAVGIDLADCGRAVGKAAPTGKLWISWDETAFHLAARLRGADGLQLALAPAFEGRWADRVGGSGWSEFAASGGPDGPKLACTLGGAQPGPVAVRRAEEESTWELSIPWSSLRPIAPGDGEFRLALAASGPGGWAEWGSGIRMGKSPDGFRVCRFAAAGAAEATSTVEDFRAPPPAAGKLLADSVAGYSKEQGRNGWFYGFYGGDARGEGDGAAPSGPYTDDDFEPMKQVETAWGTNWAGPAAYLTLSQAGSHPGVIGGRPAWAVRRWKSSVAGTLRIAGHFQHQRKGDGIEGRILVDGVQVYAKLVGGEAYPERAAFDLTVAVREGSLVDFAITPGPATNTTDDATSFHARISLIEQR